MDNAESQLAEKLTAANNILVTVSRNPSVDQLAACIALTLLLNKLDKHATAVFSGEVPSTLEFLEPEETLEKTTDSLRDFIIALDKSKADKLRYKVEDQLVRIFITPYRTSITQDDLEFSQGDFNVDLVVALGVIEQADLDTAITAHGRILHDATVSTINVNTQSALGSINWIDSQASSLCELVAQLTTQLGENLLDAQIATALLTGVVAETERFSNERTSPQTMKLSADLLAAGANQQLVSSKLQTVEPSATAQSSSIPPVTTGSNGNTQQSSAPTTSAPPEDGTLEISHNKQADETAESSLPEPVAAEEVPNENVTPQSPPADLSTPIPPGQESTLTSGAKFVTEPPSLGGVLTASTRPEPLDPSTDPLGAHNEAGALLSHDAPAAAETPSAVPLKAPSIQPLSQSEPLLTGFTPPPPAWVPPSNPVNPLASGPSDQPDAPTLPSDTLSQIEQSVNSPHLPSSSLTAARDEVTKALADSPTALEPIAALHAQPLGGELHPPEPVATSAQPLAAPVTFTPSETPLAVPGFTPGPIPDASLSNGPAILQPTPGPVPTTSPPPEVSTAPPVPPPIPYRFGNTT